MKPLLIRRSKLKRFIRIPDMIIKLWVSNKDLPLKTRVFWIVLCVRTVLRNYKNIKSPHGVRSRLKY